MKGQYSVDIYVILILFVLSVSYLFFQVIAITPTYVNEINKQRVQTEAYQISELLINDPGEPADWNKLVGTVNEGEIKRIGLSNEIANMTNLLLGSKIDSLIGKCNQPGGYGDITKWIDTNYQFSILIVNLNSGEVKACQPPLGSVVSRAVVANMTRTVAIDSDYGQLIFQLW